MFNFFSSFKNDVKAFMQEVKDAFIAAHTRIAVLENQVKTLMGDKVDAVQVKETSPNDGSSSAQPAISQETGNSTEGSKGV